MSRNLLKKKRIKLQFRTLGKNGSRHYVIDISQLNDVLWHSFQSSQQDNSNEYPNVGFEAEYLIFLNLKSKLLPLSGASTTVVIVTIMLHLKFKPPIWLGWKQYRHNDICLFLLPEVFVSGWWGVGRSVGIFSFDVSVGRSYQIITFWFHSLVVLSS